MNTKQEDTLKNKFRFFYYNFGWYGDESADSPEQAKRMARNGGFQCSIYYNGNMVATWCPIGGFTYYNRELFNIPPALVPIKVN